MDLVRFNDLKPGQFVQISGKFREGKGFLAVEITLEPAIGEAEFECQIQSVDADSRGLRLCDQTIALPSEVEIKDMSGEPAAFDILQPGTMVKLKGKYAAPAGYARRVFAPKKIKAKETMEFNIEQVQGVIDHIDRTRKTLLVNGVKILLSPQTVIERGDGVEEFRDVLVPYIPI